MGLNLLLKVLIISIIFPAQANLIEPQDYWDAWERLDEVVNSITEQVEPPNEEEVGEMEPRD